MYRAVFFDLFETLITEFKEDFKPKGDISSTITRKAFNREWSIRRPKMDTGHYKDYFEVAKEIFTSLNEKYDEKLVDKLYEERVNSKKSCFDRIDDHIIDGIKEIKNNGLKVVLVSNCSLEDVLGWKESHLSKLFDDVIFSYEVGLAKPDPRIYTLACERIGVEPKDGIFIGDGGSEELVGAAKVGMKPYYASWHIEKWPFWRQNERGRDISRTFEKLDTLTEIIDIIKNQ